MNWFASRRRCAHALIAAASLTCVGVCAAQNAPAAEAPATPPAAEKPAKILPSSWVRVTENDDGTRIALEIAIRRFQKTGEVTSPTVTMYGAVHVADKSFYDSLQEKLDASDVVLYEGVKPPGAGRIEHALGVENDEGRAKLTERRLRFVAIAVAMHQTREGSPPETLAALAEKAPDRLRSFIAGSLTDAWGNAWVYSVRAAGQGEQQAGDAAKQAFEIASLGSDAMPGGEAHAGDIEFSKLKPFSAAEKEMIKQGAGAGGAAKSDDNIQAQLAKALGLVFQLDAMSHSGANWRNSDLSIDQVQERLSSGGADGSALFQMLDGSSFTAKFASVLLRFIGASPMMSTMMKTMVVDMLGQADALLSGMPGEMGKLMDVIIKDRNAVVVDDLSKILADEPTKKNIGIIYGAGHMVDLEARLEAMGFAPVGEQWVRAIDVDLTKAGLDPKQMKQMRAQMKAAIERQIKMQQRVKE
jgi:hypothetical protein